MTFVTRPAVVLSVAIGLLAAACGGHSAPTALVRAHGTIVSVGGTSGPPRPLPRVRFTVTDRDNSAKVVTDEHGRFAFDVLPGTYRVVITGHSVRANGRLSQPHPRTIVVQPHAKPLRLWVSPMVR